MCRYLVWIGFSLAVCSAAADTDESGGFDQSAATLLGGDELNFTDIAFAAMSGPWLMPPEYAAGRADAVRFEGDRAPADYRRVVAEWMKTYPLTVAFVKRLYAEERTP